VIDRSMRSRCIKRERERERTSPEEEKGERRGNQSVFFFPTIGECEKRELRTKWKKNNNKKKKKERDGSFDASVAERLAAMQSSPRWQP